MLSSLAAWSVRILPIWGYPGLIVLMGLESMGLPLPSEVILPLSGYLVSQGVLSLPGAILAANVGGLLGFLIQYAIGRYGGRPLVFRYGPYLRLTPSKIELASRWFLRYGPRAVFIGRLVPVVRGLVSLPAGAAGMPPIPFLVWSLAGALPWSIALIVAGRAAGAVWPRISAWAQPVGLGLLLFASVIGIGLVVHRLSAVVKSPKKGPR